ncbi:acetyl-CoA carboxylase biotin carboxyl carrier protein [Fusobacterium sp. IOR10]|uniref:acetyl-CoA carboxylase biotin carboxyl carrier protein n=1 Tax=Fusobacterium sp. IOR10 TaxID=2665157 RepID=UPI0013D1C46C|nr:acetyl-CoA carboxylase biotin carboxyl carrier protein [Fusobacterium sp. IOR10]
MKNINLELIEKLADKINENSLKEISIEKGDEKITLKKEVMNNSVVYTRENVNKKMDSTTPKNITTKKEKEVINGNIILAPTVGTFYGSPSPGKAPFINEGDQVQVGDPVCIIEAMKMMNEVTSNFNGKIVKILVKDGAVVQRGDQLFVVE